MRLEFNFASREYLLARKLYAHFCLGLLVCAAAFALSYSGYRHNLAEEGRLTQRILEEEARLGETQNKLGLYAGQINKDAIEATYNEASFANSAIIRRVFSWTLFLNRFEDLVPEGVGITGIKPNFQSLDVDLSGTARDMDRLTEFVDRLTRSEYFGDIPPTFSAKEMVTDIDIGKPVQTFFIKIRYIPEPAAGGEGG